MRRGWYHKTIASALHTDTALRQPKLQLLSTSTHYLGADQPSDQHWSMKVSCDNNKNSSRRPTALGTHSNQDRTTKINRAFFFLQNYGMEGNSNFNLQETALSQKQTAKFNEPAHLVQTED
jgi:hypothetical protein